MIINKAFFNQLEGSVQFLENSYPGQQYEERWEAMALTS